MINKINLVYIKKLFTIKHKNLKKLKLFFKNKSIKLKIKANN